MRKKEKRIAVAAAIMAGMVLAGCGGNGGESQTSESTAKEETQNTDTSSAETQEGSGEKIELTFFHYLEQYQEQFETLKALYAEENPNVELKVEIIGADYDKILQTRVATGEVPDIFLSGPYNMNELYSSVCYDLENEAFVDDITIGGEYRASNGELSGIPFTSQAWGILYNQEVFEKAGITELPETLDELEQVCIKLQDAGYIPFAQGYKSDYIKNQFFGFPYAVDEQYEQNIQQLSNKEKTLKDFDFINKIFDCAELVGKYTQENPFNDDFAAAATRLGVGEAAMMISGDWIVENAQKANPDCKIGLMALPLSDNPDDAKIYVADSVGLHVNKDSENLDAALEFVNWLVTSQEAKDWFSNDMKALSAIKGVTPKDSQVLTDALEYMNEGKTGAWASYLFPQGLETELTPTIDKYLLGNITREEAIDEMSTTWQEFE